MNAFISYSSADRQIALRVAEVLRMRGLSVWIDQGALGPGDSLASSIAEALHSVDFFVVLLTPNSFNSKWVTFELNTIVPRFVNGNARIVPLLFEGGAVPESLSAFVYGDCRAHDGLVTAINRALKGSAYEVPMPAEAIQRRREARDIPNHGIRLIPESNIDADKYLGIPQRPYVLIGDYAEQCGRSLREVMERLFVGEYFDRITDANAHWMAVVFEIGSLHWKNYDLMPATWKAMFRILSDKKRLGLIEPSADDVRRMGRSPRDYYEDNGWLDRVLEIVRAIDPSTNTELLEAKFGLHSTCFSAASLGGSGTSRFFFVKNCRLETLNYHIQHLGHVDDGILVT
jgi:hypothetical protein